MLLRAFATNRKPLLLALFGLSLMIGIFEGSFILIAKSAVTGAGWQTWSIPLLALAAIVTLRTLTQFLSTRLELRGMFGWLHERRESLLRAASLRSFPAYRNPWRNTLVTALDEGLDDLGQGISAGIRCLAALTHALVLAPLLFLFSWKLAVGALALAVPALLASRLRAGMLAESATRWSESKATLSADMEAFAEGLEAHAGNGRLAYSAERLSGGMERHARRARSWETAKAVFPPALEWFFFMALAGLALAAGAAGTAASPAGSGPLALLPFGGLLLLMYRPIREWARNYPMHLMGSQAWRTLCNLQDTLESFPLRGPRPASPTGLIRIENVRFAYASGLGPASDASIPRVLDGLDLEIGPQDMIWISGRNGAGKSTFLKLLAGIETPQAGRILVPRLWVDSPFAYLPQKAFVESDWGEWAQSFRTRNPSAWKELDGILGHARILAKSGSGTPSDVSGGERQRLCLARVFASPAPYLLLDEPTTWLAACDRERIMGDLLEFWKNPGPGGTGRGAALVSHEPFLGEFCSRTIRLDAEAVGARR
ncbi:MAG: ABC transporter ATP-binding protein/permease [Fibrobacterota bacterium]|nr:ABC transporter ATP-binding protein/permease [Fibrobacterota bacterium]